MQFGIQGPTLKPQGLGAVVVASIQALQIHSPYNLKLQTLNLTSHKFKARNIQKPGVRNLTPLRKARTDAV